MHWIQNSYEKFRQIPDGPWFILMGNCSGRELAVTLDRVRIEVLPSRFTMKHQTLYLGLSGTAEILDRPKLLSDVLDVMEMKRNTNHSFK